MKSFLKILSVIALLLAMPAHAAIMNFTLDTMIVAQPVTLSGTSDSQDLSKVILQNTTLDLQPLVLWEQEIKTFDTLKMSSYELQIYNDLQKQLSFSLEPKIFDIDENEFNKSLFLYREDRVAEINRVHAGNIAAVNDEIGFLDQDVDSFASNLRQQLELRAVLMEKEQAQLIVNLQNSLTDFKNYYELKVFDESALRSGSLLDSPIVMDMDKKIEGSEILYKSVTEQQSKTLDVVIAAKNDNDLDSSLSESYFESLEKQIVSDMDLIPMVLDDLQEQREKIVTLSNDIQLLSSPMLVEDFDDQLVLEEQSDLLSTKELELQAELEVYYQMQQDTQLILSSSFTNLNTFNLIQ